MQKIKNLFIFKRKKRKKLKTKQKFYHNKKTNIFFTQN